MKKKNWVKLTRYVEFVLSLNPLQHVTVQSTLTPIIRKKWKLKTTIYFNQKLFFFKFLT